MKHFTTILFLLTCMGFIVVPSGKKFNPKTIRSSLKGEWTYSYSLKDGERREVPFDKFCPAPRMVFSECNDAKEMKINSPIVVNMRKTNVLKDLKCNMYDSTGTRIDTYFPVVHFNPDSTAATMLIYGLRYKDDFFIHELSADSMVVSGHRVYTFNNQPCYQLYHVYHRKKK